MKQIQLSQVLNGSFRRVALQGLIFVSLMSGLNTASMAAQGPSIAVVDQFAAIMETDEAQKLHEQYKTEVEAERGKLVALDSEVTELNARLEKEGEVMSSSEVNRLKSSIEDKQLDRNVLIKKVRNRTQDVQQEIASALGAKFQEVMTKIQDERSYDLILQKQAALYASDKYDITQEVTAKINKMK